MTEIYFNIYGLPLEISSDYPLLLETFQEDLKWFQCENGNYKKSLIHLKLNLLSKQKAVAARRRMSNITVICHPKRRWIQAGIFPSPSTLPDPAYHYCFTKPVDPWLKERGLFPIHAACVSEKGHGILIVGKPGAGKSTLSVSAVRAGFQFLGDEQPLISRRSSKLRIYAFPRRIRLDQSVAEIFPELRSLLISLTSKRIVFSVEKIWPGCLASDCEPRFLIFPNFRTRGQLQLDRLPSSKALVRLLQDDYFIWYKKRSWNKIFHEHLTLFQKLVEKVPAFSLDYGPNDILGIPSLFKQLLHR